MTKNKFLEEIFNFISSHNVSFVIETESLNANIIYNVYHVYYDNIKYIMYIYSV